jgi:Fe2+ transport system protein FeoA
MPDPAHSPCNPSEGGEYLCPLSQLKVGSACQVRQLAASPDVAHRLRELGFCEAQRIRLLGRHANVICQVCNVRLGISTELADMILVAPLPPKKSAA